MATVTSMGGIAIGHSETQHVVVLNTTWEYRMYLTVLFNDPGLRTATRIQSTTTANDKG